MGQENVNQLVKKQEGLCGKLKCEQDRLEDQKKQAETALGKVEATTKAAQKIAPSRVDTNRYWRIVYNVVQLDSNIY